MIKKIISLIKESYWKAWYNYINKSDKDNELTFMNYGYAYYSPLELKSKDEKNRYQIQLYDKIVKAIPSPIEKSDMLEVGCGRGGGANYISEYLSPKSLDGIDICKPAIDFCRKNRIRGISNVFFNEGDAMRIPHSNDFFDAVINIESSHRYPDMPKFLGEVKRVLKQEGYFSFVDFRATERIPELDDLMSFSGMNLLEEEVVTPEVLKALELDNARKLDMIARLVPKILHKPAREFASVIGSASYNSLIDGKREYKRYLLKK